MKESKTCPCDSKEIMKESKTCPCDSTCFDKEILETGFTACIKSNSVIMAAPGMVNGVQGFYTVGINNSGIIYHRCFYAAQDFYRSFPNSILP